MTKTCKIYWDDLSYQLSNESAGYAIVNIPGLPYKITWDTQQHIINNPNNFSYSIITNATYCYLYVNHPTRGKLYNNGYGSYQILTFGPIGKQQWTYNNGVPRYTNAYATNWFDWYYGAMLRLSTTVGFFNSGFMEKTNGDDIYQNNIGYPNRVAITIQIEPINPTYQLRIIDNGIVYNYSIINRDLINVIKSDPSIKIEIEGHQFDIIDTNSARKDCTEQCPPDSITCDCGNERCCYKQVEYGYQLVKTIVLED